MSSKTLSGEDGSQDWPWKVGALPFIYAPLDSPTNGNDLPDALPFALDVNRRVGTLVQVPDEMVSNALSNAYLKGSIMSGMMDEDGIGREYAQDFLSFLAHSIKKDRFDGMSVLEIGCGTGYLLYRLKLLGADVLGVEPGDHGQEGSRRFQIPVIRDFFPSRLIEGRYDVIIMYGVLEHLGFPREFLQLLPEHLSDNGRIVLSVPNCQPFIELGDVSMLTHQHWNYYTQDTLRNSVRLAIGSDLDVQSSEFGGSLYGITTKHAVKGQIDIEQEAQRALRYKHLGTRGIGKLLRYLARARSRCESVGIYVPGRAINALSIIKERIDVSNLRFFDDNNALRGKYFPGFDIPIEGREGLISRPTDRVLIMSHTFGTSVANGIRSTLGNSLTITMWRDLLTI
jgi:SAM-dependent methyltransferase